MSHKSVRITIFTWGPWATSSTREIVISNEQSWSKEMEISLFRKSSRVFFHHVVIISLLKVRTNVISLQKGMLNAEFAWNWPSGSGEEDLSKVASVFNFIVMISPCKRAWLLFRILHPSDFFFFCILGANFTLWQTLWRHHFQKLVFKTVIPFDKIIQTAATLQNKNSPRKSPIIVYLMEHKFS